ncbi:MAG: molecular chaperone TorD family protein [Burkholderiales bacterium]|nr:molecular chaperone TorD family protein [Burkholderiales bacterium]
MSAGPAAAGSGDLAPEEALRADLYGLIARLFAAPPDAPLLAAIAGSPADLGGAGTALGRAWAALQAAAARADAHEAAITHAELFVGTGRARVSIYASHHLTDVGREHALVALRDELGGLGLERQAGVTQPEDHLAALLEVMRHLALRGADAGALEIQRRFFERYLGPWYGAFAGEVLAATADGFFCGAARILQAFLDLEKAGFALEN